MGFQYDNNLYFGVNLNSHFIDYDNYTILNETNNNGDTGQFRVNGIYFEKMLEKEFITENFENVKRCLK